MGSVVNFTYQWPDYGDEIAFFCRFTLAFCAMDKIAFFEEWLSLYSV